VSTHLHVLLFFLQAKKVDMADVQPFDAHIPADEVSRLFRKLGDTRLPSAPIVPDAGDEYGAPWPTFISLQTPRGV